MSKDTDEVIQEIAENVKALPDDTRKKILCVLQGVSIGINAGKEAKK